MMSISQLLFLIYNVSLRHGREVDVPLIKCDYCGKEKLTPIRLKDYAYKRTEKNGKRFYFCSYDCARKAEKENPNRFRSGRLV